ncbi:MAG TPA: DUF4349 domain-containing protein [Tepidisphaeraceae bacterium]|nr:DUF4349 domain-containing protein [Tepidisphaeraceae bacterium]
MKYDDTDTGHDRFRDDVAVYLAGGLHGPDRAAFESHALHCGACGDLLTEAREEDAKMTQLFSAAHPAAGFEDRLVAAFRTGEREEDLQNKSRLFIHPMVRRAATGVAAALLLGGFGYVASNAINGGGLPAPWAKSPQLVSVHTNSEVASGERLVNGLLGGLAVEQQRTDSPADMARSWNETIRGELRGFQEADESGPARARGAATELDRREKLTEDAYLKSRALAGVEVNAPQNSQPAVAGKPVNGRGGENVFYADGNAPPGATPQVVDGFGLAVPPQSGMGGQAGGGGFSGRSSGMGGPAVASVTPPPPAAEPKDAPAAERASEAARDGTAVAKNVPESAAASDYSYQNPLPNTWEHKAGGDSGVATKYFRQFEHFADVSDADKKAVDAKAVDKEVEEFAKDAQAEGRQGQRAGREATPQAQQRVAQQQLRQLQEVRREPQQLAQAGQQPSPGTPNASQPQQPTAPAPAPNNPAAGRKIIRNGDMSFEVDSFDSAYLQITKIASEEGGFVATTDSEKLANGKVRGMVVVRVPPERLDTLVLKLRGLGDLKSSKIAAQDITKQYTDLESQLRAAKTMEDRLLEIIKSGKGEVKDLVEAEKQLGVYREKIERLEGEIRYYNNLVSLSTLNVTLMERDIRTAAMLSETEQVSMGVEADDVEKARASALAAVEQAKGRIVESDLKKLEAGQFAAKVVADVPPDAAGPLIDRMRQIGNVARLEVARKQATPEGTVAPAPAAGVRVERRDTRFVISMYNLANVAPRVSTTLNLAAADVEVAYKTVLDQVTSAGGRVVTSQLNRPRPDQTTGTITFEAPADKADVLLGAVRGAGEVMRLEVTQNPDTQNTTDAKRGFAVQVFSLASVPARETTSLRIAARGVADAFNALREAVRTATGGRVLTSQLNQQDTNNVSGTLDFEVPRDQWASVETALGQAGQFLSRNVTRSADTENTVDSKIRLQVQLADESTIPPRQSEAMHVAVVDVPAQYATILEALRVSNARVLQSQLTEQQNSASVTGTLVFDVRREARAGVDKAVGDAGDVVTRNVQRSNDTQNTLDDKVRLQLTLTDADNLPPRETTTLGIEARDVEKAKENVQSLALSLGGRVVDSSLSREPNGRVYGKLVADVPLEKALEMVNRSRDQGRVSVRRDARDENVPPGKLARARVNLTLFNEEMIVDQGEGLGTRIREGLRTSVAGLLWSVQLVVVGLFLVAPWVLIVWFAWKLLKRGRRRTVTTTTTPPIAPSPA